MSTDTQQAAREAYDEAMQAVTKWSKTNEQRMHIGEQVVALAQGGQEHERTQAVSAYQQLCEMEMLFGGTAIVALAKAHQEAVRAFHEATGEPLLSGPDATTTG